MSNSPRVRDYSKDSGKNREVFIAIACVLAVLGFVFYGVSQMGKQAGQSGMHGKVVEKHYDPVEQTQISVGSGGLHQQEVKGEYWLKVHVENRAINYYVYVPRGVYQKHKVGDDYFFVRPPKPSHQKRPDSN